MYTLSWCGVVRDSVWAWLILVVCGVCGCCSGISGLVFWCCSWWSFVLTYRGSGWGVFMSWCFGRYYFRFVSFTWDVVECESELVCGVCVEFCGLIGDWCVSKHNIAYDVLRWCLLSFRWRRYLYKSLLVWFIVVCGSRWWCKVRLERWGVFGCRLNSLVRFVHWLLCVVLFEILFVKRFNC